MGSLAKASVLNISDNAAAASNTWIELLSEVREQKSSSRYAKRNVVLLGDHGSGKSALLAALRHGGGVSVGSNAIASSGAIVAPSSTQQQPQNPELHTNLILLGHNWFAFKDDVRDETLHFDVWSVDHPNVINVLFEYGITKHEEELPNTMFCFVNSMSQPWIALDRMQIWFAALQNAVAQLKIDMSVLSAWERDRELDFINFREQQQQSADKSAAPPMNLAGGTLGSHALTVQSGLNLLVVMTKSDSTVKLERDLNWRDQHFDYLQLALRQWCLAHGASLIYTSARTGKNVGLLLNYVSSRLIYSYFNNHKRADGVSAAVESSENAPAGRRAASTLQFNEAAHILEKDDVFVPLGWDSDKKIDVLLDSINLATTSSSKKLNRQTGAVTDNGDGDADADEQMIDSNGVPNAEYFENLLVPVQLRKVFQQQKDHARLQSAAGGGSGDATSAEKAQQHQRFEDEEQQFLGEIRQLLEVSSAASASNSATDTASKQHHQHADAANGENHAESADILNAMLEAGGTNRPMSAGNTGVAMTPAKARVGVTGGSGGLSSAASAATLTPMGSVGPTTDKAVSMFFEEMLRKKPTMPASSDLNANPALK